MGVSTQYLPSEVRAYSSTFDEYGDWRYQQSYGYVWYPRVDVGWRPYYYGRWAPYPRYGWTWIGADRFAWPTHHYGRWGFSANAWFWIPANRWAPAHVSWAYAPGYVSWCPLGFDNRPVIGVNIFNVGAGYYSSRAWTAIGYTHFGRDYVHHRAVDWDRFDRNRRPSFQVGRSAPAYRDVAVPRGSTGAQGLPSNVGGRNSTPIRSVGSRDLPPDRLRQGSGAREAASQSVGAGLSSPSRNTSVGSSAPSGGRSLDTAAPRYINRGDEIVRSRTGRPSAPTQDLAGVPAIPDSAARDAAVIRTGSAIQRTAPGGPAQRIDSLGVTAVPDSSGIERSRGARDAGAGRYVPRSIYDSPGRAQPRGGVEPRPDSPAYQPQPYQAPTRTYERTDGGQSPSRSAQPRGGGVEARPAPAPAPAAPAAAPGSSVGGGRQAPAPRATPSPERSAPSGGGTAVPRSGARGRGGA